jgi:hypothetical protein
MPVLTMDCVPVPEPRTVKNLIHWDVTVPGMTPLVAAGPGVLREPGGGIGWHVLAGPEGKRVLRVHQVKTAASPLRRTPRIVEDSCDCGEAAGRVPAGEGTPPPRLRSLARQADQSAE